MPDTYGMLCIANHSINLTAPLVVALITPSASLMSPCLSSNQHYVLVIVVPSLLRNSLVYAAGECEISDNSVFHDFAEASDFAISSNDTTRGNAS